MIKTKLIAVCSLFLALTCFPHTGKATMGREYAFSGKTMGTFYTVKFISNHDLSVATWKEKVDMRLKEVNQRLSMYDPKSELSRFNRSGIEIPFTASPDFFAVLETGADLYQMTDGAWDGTIKPLVDLWGFGTREGHHIPADEKIREARSKIGFSHIVIRPPRTVTKQKALTLDLGSIAKGYGVDAVANLFTDSGIRNVLVEIGGELSASGKNSKGEDWSVGISRPEKRFTGQTLFKIVRLHDQAIATSGNYRNYFEENQKTFSHIIDPRTGFPTDNRIVSASVISGNCTFADGLATALMVMEVKKSLELVNRLPHTECLIIQKEGKELISHMSRHFTDFLVE